MVVERHPSRNEGSNEQRTAARRPGDQVPQHLTEGVSVRLTLSADDVDSSQVADPEDPLGAWRLHAAPLWIQFFGHATTSRQLASYAIRVDSQNVTQHFGQRSQVHDRLAGQWLRRSPR